MQNFKVTAWPKYPSDWEETPEWEVIIAADVEGEAYSQGLAQFHAYCIDHKLQFEDFQVRSGSL